MKPLSCIDARQQLAAFHDRELALEDEVRISRHVERCARCQAELAELRALGAALQMSVPPRVLPSDDEASALAVAALAQIRVRRHVTIEARLGRAFSDWRVIVAGLGATVATVACAVSILTLLRAATDPRPDSLAALVDSLATPELNANPSIDGNIETRWSERFRQANETAEQDAVFALSEAVVKEQRLLRAEGSRRRRAGSTRPSPVEPDSNVKEIYALLDVVSRARFESAREARLSALPWVAVSTTVRAAKPQPLAAPISLPKSPTAQLPSRSTRV